MRHEARQRAVEEGRLPRWEATRETGHQIGTLLAEFRMLIPFLGVLLGFELTTAFTETFSALPSTTRIANGVAIGATLAAVVSLLVPASYHRFGPTLDESEEYLRFARRTMGFAFAFMTAALVLIVYVQAERAANDARVSLVAAITALTTLLVVWWAYPRRRASARRPGGAAAR